jgi:hypothetical protein
MVNETEVFASSDLTLLYLCLSGSVRGEVQKIKVDTRDELFARNLHAAARVKKRENQLGRTTRDPRTRVAKCTDVNGGIFEYLLWTVTNVI